MDFTIINLNIETFINCDKFKTYVNLQPAVENSTVDDQKLINQMFNDAAREIQILITNNSFSEESVKKVFEELIDKIETTRLDTEDYEFCFELVYVLSEITGVDINYLMQKKNDEFLSGDMLTNILKKSGIDPKQFGL